MPNKHNSSRRKVLSLSLSAASLALLPFAAKAQSYPSKTIKIIVPSPPGGSTDLIARLIGNRLTTLWGQSVIVDNKPGAGLRIGAEFVAKSAPDGYTLLMAAVHHSIAQAVYKKRSYELERDLTPITIAAIVPNVLIVPATLPVRNVKEFIELAKAKPGQISYGSTGSGTAHHIIGEQFAEMSGTKLLHVPYKGSAPALVDLMSGEIQAMFDTIASCLPHIKSGKLRALAVTTSKRSSALPDIPTLAESGLTGFEVSTWFGLMAPAGTPPDIVARINKGVVGLLAIPEIRDSLLASGAEPVGSGVEQMAQQIRNEVQKFTALAAKTNLELD